MIAFIPARYYWYNEEDMSKEAFLRGFTGGEIPRKLKTQRSKEEALAAYLKDYPQFAENNVTPVTKSVTKVEDVTKVGRPKAHADHAARQAAYRERKHG